MSKKGSQKHPLVFISYSQDSPEHKDKVLAFANKLRRDGIDALLDQYEESPREGWPKWMDRQIENSDFVLLVCTETYCRRVMGTEKKGKGLGVRWESTLVYQDVYDAGSEVTRFVPVLFKDGKPKHVPKPLKSLTYYRVDTEEGYDDLYRRLTDQPKTIKPGLGKLKSLSPRKPKADFLQSSGTETGKSVGAPEQIEVIPTSEPTPDEQQPKPGTVVTNSINMKLVYIPTGSFMMGSRRSAAQLAREYDTKESIFEDYFPQHLVRISKGFWMGQTQVTQGQYKSVMDAQPWSGKKYVQEDANNPAVHVSWDDAIEFCRKLSQQEGKTYRLPNEAEWEYACRAGTTTRFSFGNSDSLLSDYAWFNGNAYEVGQEYAHSVRQKNPNPWDLYDMHGNVWEWCSDFYNEDYYSNSPSAYPKGLSSGASRSLRGGSWLNPGLHLTCSFRLSDIHVSRNDEVVGFRVVRSP